MGSEQFAKRLQVGVDSISTSNTHSSMGQDAQMSKERCWNARRNTETFAEKSSGTGSGLAQSRVLQPILCSSQKRSWEMEKHFGLEQSQQLYRQREVQDGHCRNDSRPSQARGVGNIARSHRCLPPHPNTTSLPQVSSLHFQRQGVPISFITNGSNCFTQGVHEGHKVHQTLSTQTVSQNTSISRRLDNSCGVQRQDFIPYTQGSAVDKGIRFLSKPRQVRIDPNSRYNVPSLQVPFTSGITVSNSRTLGENSAENSPLLVAAQSSGATVAVNAGRVDSHRKTSTFGNVAHSPHTSGITGTVVTVPRQSDALDYSIRRSAGSTTLVDSEGKCDDRSAITSNTASTSNLLRCKSPRLGRSSGGAECTREMDHSRRTAPYKCVRTASCMESSTSICAQNPTHSSHGGLGQYHHSGVHQKTGRHQIANPATSDTGVLRLARDAPHLDHLPTYSGTLKCTGGQSLQTGGNSCHRMVAASTSSGSAMDSVGQTSLRHVCNEVQFQVAPIRISDTGPSSSGSGCHVSRLDEQVYVHIPTHSDAQQSTGEDAYNSLYSNLSSPSMATTEVVPRHIGTTSGLSSRATSREEATKTTKIISVSSEPRCISASRVEVIQRSHTDRGFSEPVAQRMARAQKESSIAIYEGKWKSFCHWCQERDADPLQADAQLVADFLCFLHETKQLAYSTIEGYRTAIGSTIRAVRGIDINTDMRISALLANFARDRIRRKPSLPNWDLSMVLYMLTKGPFEPMHQASLKHVTLKSVFLIALATGKRRGELHALQKEVLHTEGWGSMTLLPDTEFVAKTELGNKGAAVIKPITVPKKKKILQEDMQEDRSLCPVRAIKYYLKMTKENRGTRRKLFLAYKAGWNTDKEIHPNTISSWIKKVILMAYEATSEEDRKLMKVTAHQVRGMAASWALQRNVAVEDIMAACSWKSHNTFTQYYLKDLALISEKMYHLGPVIVAQHSA